MLSPKLILSPIDFSPLSLEALDVAQDLATRYGSEILLLHVAPVVPDLPDKISMLHEDTYEKDLIRNAGERLQELAAKLQEAGIKATTRVGMANEPAMEIVRDAENADLIVISAHGMTGWRSIAFGSVAEKVVHNATCPVLVLRAKTAAESSAGAAKAAAQVN